MASFRLADIYRLGKFRQAHGLDMDARRFGFVIAVALSQLPVGFLGPGKYVGSRCVRWPGLTVETLRNGLGRCGLDLDLDEDALVELIEHVENWQAKNGVLQLSAEKAGQLLEVTAAERQACRITTMHAVDQDRAARQAEAAERKRARDRERQRQKRTNRLPRDKYLANSISQLKPWTFVDPKMGRTVFYRVPAADRDHIIERARQGLRTGVSPYQIKSLTS